MSHRVPQGSNTVVLKVNLPVDSRTTGLSGDCLSWCCWVPQALHREVPQQWETQPEKGQEHLQPPVLTGIWAQGKPDRAPAPATPMLQVPPRHVCMTLPTAQSVFTPHMPDGEWKNQGKPQKARSGPTWTHTTKPECKDECQLSQNMKPDSPGVWVTVLPFLSSRIWGKFLNFSAILLFCREATKWSGEEGSSRIGRSGLKFGVCLVHTVYSLIIYTVFTVYKIRSLLWGWNEVKNICKVYICIYSP